MASIKREKGNLDECFLPGYSRTIQDVKGGEKYIDKLGYCYLPRWYRYCFLPSGFGADSAWCGTDLMQHGADVGSADYDSAI